MDLRTRTEEEILELLIDFTSADDRIRTVVMTGSRVDPRAPRDPFQDFDIMCFTTDVEPFKNRDYVIPRFGETLVVEQPNIGPWPPSDADGSYHNYNIQFMDGNRIDLAFYHVDTLAHRVQDSLIKVLLDKDALCTEIRPPSASSYYITPPTEALYEGCCTAFFFALGSHIPKTIWRRRLPLLKYYIEAWLREPVMMMLSWEVGIRHGYNLSIGSRGKYLQEYLDPEMWVKYVQTYVGADYGDLWASLFLFHDIFSRSAMAVADGHGFMFPKEQGQRVLDFLRHVRGMPTNAERIYE